MTRKKIAQKSGNKWKQCSYKTSRYIKDHQGISLTTCCCWFPMVSCLTIVALSWNSVAVAAHGGLGFMWEAAKTSSDEDGAWTAPPHLCPTSKTLGAAKQDTPCAPNPDISKSLKKSIAIFIDTKYIKQYQTYLNIIIIINIHVQSLHWKWNHAAALHSWTSPREADPCAKIEPRWHYP